MVSVIFLAKHGLEMISSVIKKVHTPARTGFPGYVEMDICAHYYAHFWYLLQSLIIPEKFQHILRVMNTNIDGKTKIMFAMTNIKGVGRRYSNVVLKKADIDLTKRAGELTEEEVSFIKLRLRSKWFYVNTNEQLCGFSRRLRK